MKINLIYDPSVQGAPPGFARALTHAAQFLGGLFSNPITVNVSVGYGEVNGTPVDRVVAATELQNSVDTTYTQLRTDLTQNALSPAAIAAVNGLPIDDPTHGGTFEIGGAERKALGLLAPASPAIDAAVGFNATMKFSYDSRHRALPGAIDFMGIAEHELTHALGRSAGLEPSAYRTLDLFRFAAPGVPQLQAGQPAYFSIDGGQTNLANFATSGDFGDWSSSGPPDANKCSGGKDVQNPFTPADVVAMQALGFNLSGSSREADGAGEPAKTFSYGAHPGHVLINDFQLSGPSHDTLDLAATGFTSLRDVLLNTTMSGGDAVIHFTDPIDNITIADVTKTQMSQRPGDFAFG